MPNQTANLPVIAVPPEEVLGPAMRALTEARRAFVTAMLETGAQSASAAAGIAGFGGTEGARRVAAHRMMHDPKVMAAIREEADRRLSSSAILAASALVEIAGDKFHKDRFKASVELLNRAGLLVETRHKITVEDNRSDSEVEQAIILLARKHSLDPRALLGYSPASEKPKVEDAEFEELSSEGLEDLLA